ncbi:MAG: PA2169 family four-helix-bundle protein [Nonlabens sp.]
MNYTDEVAGKLNNLLEKNYDAEAGYKLAKDKVNSGKVKEFFNQQQQERYNFGHELKEEIRNYGGTPDKGTSFAADAHRAWINVKAAIAGDQEEAVLEEAIRGEKSAIEEYNEVINDSTLPASTKSILTKHRDNIQNALNSVNRMEEAH